MSAIIITNWVGQVGMASAVCALKEKRPLLGVIEAGIKQAESDPTVPHAGIGGAVNMIGELETDASIMDGDSLRIGAVGALKGYANPVAVAREILEVLPHTMLVGEGAAMFAAERGLQRFERLPENVELDYQEWLKERVPEDLRASWPKPPLARFAWLESDEREAKDTVVYLARDADGQIAGGASSSGWAYKYPGRLGDSPIIGAGLYADSRFGACACTDTGEMTMRAGTARAVVAYMKAGASVEEACHEAVDDLRQLKGGYLGPVVIHAIDRTGAPYVLSTERQEHYCWIWSDKTDAIMPLKPEVDEIVFA